MDSGASWGGQGGNRNGSPGAQVHVDFQQYLDLGMPGLSDDGSFGYEDFNGQSHQQNEQMIRQDDMGGMDTNMGNGNHMAHLQQKQSIMQGHQITAQGSQQHQSPSRNENNGSNHGRNNSLNEIDAQIQYLQLQRQQQQQRLVQEQQQNYYVHQTTRIIPPTPNSMEMHSRDRQQFGQGNGHGHDMQQPFMYDAPQIQMRQHDLAFTPLVSPAVTPLDTNFHIPDYSMPGAFFSPLTSPALHAENGYGSLYAPSHALSSVGTSPTEMSLDLLPLPRNQGGIARKLSGQNQARGAGKAPAKPRVTRAVRQSPIVKPQNARRKPTITSISPETLSELVEPALVDSRTPSSHASSQPSDSLNCSPNKDSISPEHLSDMAPPPLPAPRSVMGSPFLMPQNSHPRVQQLIAGNLSAIPATPASLMKIARGKEEDESLTSPVLEMSIDEEDQDHFMDGFSLPEPAADETMLRDEHQAFTMESERSPLALSELPPPAVVQVPLPVSSVVKQSPTIKRQPASASSHSTPSLRKTPKLAARGSQPRHGGGSVQASPALLPRISPSIKPQNSQQRHSLSDDTAQLLLTTKSNYQNILEGNHLPGVSYPSELSTNLTSKRTSHKIAEQGRRNRINIALQEIATLLPVNKTGGKPTSGGDEEGKEDGTGSGGGGGKGTSAGSKASTVEQAIQYIKKLKEEVECANRRAEEAEKKLMEKVAGEEGN